MARSGPEMGALHHELWRPSGIFLTVMTWEVEFVLESTLRDSTPSPNLKSQSLAHLGDTVLGYPHGHKPSDNSSGFVLIFQFQLD